MPVHSNFRVQALSSATREATAVGSPCTTPRGCPLQQRRPRAARKLIHELILKKEEEGSYHFDILSTCMHLADILGFHYDSPLYHVYFRNHQ